MTYFDYSATTPIAESVLHLMNRVERDFFANINAQHALAQKSRSFVLDYVEKMAYELNIDSRNLVFTSGATESNNMVLQGLAKFYPTKKHIITTQVEHHSVIAVLGELQRQGYEIEFIPSIRGHLDLHAFEQLIREDTLCVTIIAVESETGLIHPLKEIKAICDKHNVPLHSDMTQAMGKVSIDFNNITYASFSSHKVYGPKGIGACVLMRNDIKPLIFGGRSLSKLRSGTPPNALIVGFAQAIIESQQALLERINVVHNLRKKLEFGLSNYQDVHVNTPTHGVEHICNISFIGQARHRLVEKLSQLGYDVSASSACSGQDEVSKIVLQISGSVECATSSIRISLSHLTSEAEIDDLLHAIGKVIG